jgi:hypothetical protein
MVDMIDHENFPWAKIECKFESEIEKRFRDKGDREYITIEASIYDIIISVKSGKREHVGLLKYFNSLFTELSENLSEQEKTHVVSAVKNLLLTFDKRYLNFVGELAVLNQLKKTGNFNLHKHEFKLPNKKTIDFDLEILEPNMRILLEVLNIHINEQKVENDFDKIKGFFERRISDKIDSKKMNLQPDYNIHIIPVVWGSYEQLVIYRDFFKENSLDVDLAHEPLSFLMLSDGEDYYHFQFSPLSQLP